MVRPVLIDVEWANTSLAIIGALGQVLIFMTTTVEFVVPFDPEARDLSLAEDRAQ